MTERRMDGTSAFNSRTVGEDVSSFLIQQGEGEVDRDPAARRRGGGSSGDPGRASPSASRRERCHGREREAPGARVLLPPLPPTIYRAPGGRRPWEIPSPGGGGQGGGLPPKPSGAPPPPGFPTLGAGEAQGGRTSPPVAGSPPHFSPWGPPGQVAPPGGPPGPFRWSRYNTDNPRNFPGGRNWTSYI